MLRRWLLGLAALYLAIAVVLLLSGVAPWLAVYLVISGLVVAGALLFERSRYRPQVDRTRGAWQLTGERFVDPTSNRLMEVRFNPATGERDYVDIGPAPS